MLQLLFRSRRIDVRSHWGFLREREFRGLSSISGAARKYGLGWIRQVILIGWKCSATLTAKLNYAPNKNTSFFLLQVSWSPKRSIRIKLVKGKKLIIKRIIFPYNVYLYLLQTSYQKSSLQTKIKKKIQTPKTFHHMLGAYLLKDFTLSYKIPIVYLLSRGIIYWITMTRKPDKHCMRRRKTLDSCFDLIRSNSSV